MLAPAVTLLALAVFALATSPSALAQAPRLALTQIGDEVAIGTNRTGEPCRLRLMRRGAAPLNAETFNLYCEGWTQRSGELLRFKVGREWTPERLLTEGGWARRITESRLGGCKAPEPVKLAGDRPGALRACRRAEGGWPVVMMAARLDRRGGSSFSYTFETLPANAALLEHAIGVLEGQRAPEAAPPAGTLSAAIRRAESVVGASGKLVSVQDLGMAETAHRLGKLQHRAGNFTGSEAAFRRLVEIQERALGPADPSLGASFCEIALQLSLQGRFDEAGALFQRAEPLVRASLVADDLPLWTTYRAYHALHQRRHDEAERLARESLAQRPPRREPGFGEGVSLAGVAYALRGKQQHDPALVVAEQALRIFETPRGDGERSPWWAGQMYTLIGRLHRDRKQYAEARTWLNRAIERSVLFFGEGPRAADQLVSLATTHRREGDRAGALAAFRRAAAIQQRDRVARERLRLASIQPHLDFLLAEAATRPGERAVLHAEAFALAQLPREGETAKALRAMTARAAAGDPALAGVVRSLQDATRRRDRLRIGLAQETVKPADQRQPAREEALKRQLGEAEGQVAQAEQRLQAEFPRYARLVGAPPLDAAALAKLLGPDEALLALLAGREATYAFLVRGGDVHAARLSIGLDALQAEVKAVRASLALDGDRLRPFDVGAARRLHDALLAPLAAPLGGVTHLLVVPSGPLLAVPFALLVTGDGTPTPFLVRRLATTVLPSVAALAELRALARHSMAPRPFLGFGDPAFAGARGDTRAATRLASLCRQGEPVDTSILRELPRLPETAAELRTIARTLGAGPDSVVLGPRATEGAVRAADLAQHRVLAFATHGLLPGELQCQSEPGLALTPPAQASPAEDGLLDASEIATLRLDADWVVLSACNTAGPDGRLGGEALSGLARAFFYAGARALLVSHWEVASLATVELTTGLFATLAADPMLRRAEALRRTQAALLDRPPTAHPFFWAPFVLVGEGR
jgi:CHAT domain-containing protein